MIKQLFLLILFALTMFSCQEDEQAPVVFLDGTYEGIVMPTGSTSLQTMIFGQDGSLIVRHYRRIEGTEEPCLSYYQKGTYSIVAEDFTFTVEEEYRPDPTINYAGCPGESILINQLENAPMTISGNLIFSEEKRVFTLSYDCADMLNMAACAPAIEFTRINS